ncbi:MAG: cation:proton antiporter [Candidatus Aenigmarchaeota archaeon]|nr:cation:proton antiporter [Candidatus Aenigmarchaeota archaeon]
MVEQILLAMAGMLLLAKLFGELAERVGIASLVGEMAAGMLLGPILGWIVIGDFLQGFLTFGVIFLLFIAGLEVKFSEIKRHVYRASFLAAAGGLLSFFFGFMAGMFFFGNTLIAIAIGTVMISTSNGALFLLLSRTGEFDSRTGKLIIAITIADDIVGILALSFFNMYVSQSLAIGHMLTIFLVSIGFYVFILEFGAKKISRLLDKINIFRDEHILFTIPVAVTFLLAYVTHNLGMSVATGAFLAGMAMANSQFAEPIIMHKVNVMARGFLVPLFYASIGTLLIFASLNIPLIAAIIITALLGKFIGCGLFSWFTGSNWDEIKLIGVSMMPRGDENIVILQIVLLLGVITTTVYTSLVFAIVTTTVIAPILIKIAYRKRR